MTPRTTPARELILEGYDTIFARYYSDSVKVMSNSTETIEYGDKSSGSGETEGSPSVSIVSVILLTVRVSSLGFDNLPFTFACSTSLTAHLFLTHVGMFPRLSRRSIEFLVAETLAYRPELLER